MDMTWNDVCLKAMDRQEWKQWSNLLPLVLATGSTKV